MREFITHSEQETAQAAAEIAASLKAGDIILYRGEMIVYSVRFAVAHGARCH